MLQFTNAKLFDEFDTHPVSIQKQDKDGNLIGGASLQVTGREVGMTTDITPITWTSEPGSEKILELRKGSYVLHEITPPVGYLGASDISFTVDGSGVITIDNQVVDKVVMIDTEVKPCRIRIHKFDEDGKTALAGVTFSLTFVSADYPELYDVPDYRRLLKVGETVSYTTNADGEVIFDNLDQGTYELTEVKTVTGHQLMADSITIHLPIMMTEADVQKAGNVDISKADIYDGIYYFYDCLYEITNNVTFKVPMTGANGIWKYGFIGISMVIIVGVGLGLFGYELLYKKRKKKRL